MNTTMAEKSVRRAATMVTSRKRCCASDSETDGRNESDVTVEVHERSAESTTESCQRRGSRTYGAET